MFYIENKNADEFTLGMPTIQTVMAFSLNDQQLTSSFFDVCGQCHWNPLNIVLSRAIQQKCLDSFFVKRRDTGLGIVFFFLITYK